MLSLSKHDKLRATTVMLSPSKHDKLRVRGSTDCDPLPLRNAGSFH
jgi:hypothetical protein